MPIRGTVVHNVTMPLSGTGVPVAQAVDDRAIGPVIALAGVDEVGQLVVEGTDRPMRLYTELSSSDCDGTRLPSPMLNVAKPTDFQRRTSSDALSASSPENSTTFFPNLLFPLEPTSTPSPT